MQEKANDMKAQHAISQMMLQCTLLIHQLITHQSSFSYVERIVYEIKNFIQTFFQAIKTCHKQYFIVFGAEFLQR